MAHSQFFKTTNSLNQPTNEMRNRVLYFAEKAYSGVRWKLDNDFDKFANFERCLYRLDFTSSPGYPYCMQSSSIREWLKYDGISFDKDRVEELWRHTQLVLEGKYLMFLRCFVKLEPHNLKKRDSKRWRLILMSPLCVQMAWHMMFAPSNDLEIKHAEEIPSQQGIVLPHGGWKRFRQIWISRNYDVGLDKTAWDWHVSRWLLDWCLELRYRLGNGTRLEQWLVYARRLYSDMFDNPYILLSDGRVFQQDVPGIMKSGVVNTISDNSRMQVFVHILVCLTNGYNVYPLPVCVGDDTLQQSSQTGDLHAYAEYGALIKQVSQGLEFVGHDFNSPSGPKPLYVVKHFKGLLGQPKENYAAYLDAICLLYVHDPKYFWVWRNIAFTLDIPVRSRSMYLKIYDEQEESLKEFLALHSKFE